MMLLLLMPVISMVNLHQCETIFGKIVQKCTVFRHSKASWTIERNEYGVFLVSANIILMVFNII
jgi:hypothetical protein